MVTLFLHLLKMMALLDSKSRCNIGCSLGAGLDLALDVAMAELDINGDGSVDFDEFSAWFFKQDAESKAAAVTFEF